MKSEIQSDGKTVWVNSDDGCCLGRFSLAGIDIHKTAAEQMVGGIHCLDCKAGPADIADWNRFKLGMKNHYGITVADRYMPKFLKRARLATGTSLARVVA